MNLEFILKPIKNSYNTILEAPNLTTSCSIDHKSLYDLAQGRFLLNQLFDLMDSENNEQYYWRTLKLMLQDADENKLNIISKNFINYMINFGEKIIFIFETKDKIDCQKINNNNLSDLEDFLIDDASPNAKTRQLGHWIYQLKSEKNILSILFHEGKTKLENSDIPLGLLSEEGKIFADSIKYYKKIVKQCFHKIIISEDRKQLIMLIDPFALEKRVEPFEVAMNLKNALIKHKFFISKPEFTNVHFFPLIQAIYKTTNFGIVEHITFKTPHDSIYHSNAKNVDLRLDPYGRAGEGLLAKNKEEIEIYRLNLALENSSLKSSKSFLEFQGQYAMIQNKAESLPYFKIRFFPSIKSEIALKPIEQISTLV